MFGTLVLAFVVTTAAIPAPVAAPREPVLDTVVLVAASGETQAWVPGTPLPGGSFGLDHAWSWSATSGVLRLSRQDVARGRRSQPSGSLRVRATVAGRRDTVYRGPALVVSAPTEMAAEVPEALLPRYEVTFGPDGAEIPASASRSRVRVIAGDLATSPITLTEGQHTIAVQLHPARAWTLQAVDAKGAPVAGFRASLQPADSFAATRNPQILWLADARGVVRALPLPSRLGVTVAVFDPKHLPARLQGAVANLPERVVLDRGCTVRGRVVRRGRLPISGAEVDVEAWRDATSDLVVRRSGTSDDRGAFAVGPQPVGPARIEVRKSRFGTVRRDLPLSSCDGTVDVGAILLKPERPFALRVRNVDGEPVARAAVSIARESRGRTDASGRLPLSGLSLGDALEVEVKAQGYLPLQASISVAGSEHLLTLERSAGIVGRVLRPDRAPAADATLRFELGSRVQEAEVDGDGRFRLELAEQAHVRVVAAAPGYEELATEADAGGAGETLDLGDLILRSGLTITGRVVDGSTGDPLPGATVWVPRAFPGGPIVAKVMGSVQRATTDAQGGFVLSGLASAPTRAHFESASNARRTIGVHPEPGATEIDLGDVALDAGLWVTMRLREPSRSALFSAQPVSGGELDRLRSAFVDRAAQVGPLASGKVRVWVEDGQRTFCERELVLDVEQGDREIDCDDGPVRVVGDVTTSRGPAEGGRLLWVPAVSDLEAGLILRRSTNLGAGRTDVYGAGKRQVEVELGAGGTYDTDELSAGAWDVVWVSGPGRFSRALRVELSNAPLQTVPLRIPGGALAGRTVEEDGSTVAAARVQVVGRPEWALSDASGAFAIDGLEPGEYALRAALDSRTSRTATARIVEGEETPAVDLVFPARGGRLTIAVRGAGGGLSGALVYAEIDDAVRLVTTDGSGDATVPVTSGSAHRVRAAAVANGSWAFGAAREVEEGSGSYELLLGATGALSVESAATAAVTIVDGSGWDLSPVLRTLGFALVASPSAPLVVQGLPVGTYAVGAKGMLRRVEVREGELTAVRLDATAAP